jgi:hypothetical protein
VLRRCGHSLAFGGVQAVEFTAFVISKEPWSVADVKVEARHHAFLPEAIPANSGRLGARCRSLARLRERRGSSLGLRIRLFGHAYNEA